MTIKFLSSLVFTATCLAVQPTRAESARAELVCTAMLESAALEDRILIRDRFQAAANQASNLATKRLQRLMNEDSGERVRLDPKTLANVGFVSKQDGAPFEVANLSAAYVRLRRAAWDARELADKKVLCRHSVVGREKIRDHLERVERALEVASDEYARATTNAGPAPFRRDAPNRWVGMARDVATISIASGLMLREAALGAVHVRYGYPLNGLVDFGLGYFIFNSVLMPRLVGYGQFVHRRGVEAGVWASPKAQPSRAAEVQLRQNEELREILDANHLRAVATHGFTVELPMAYDEFPSGYHGRVAPSAAEIKGATIGRKGFAPPVGPRRLEVDRVLMIDPDVQDWTLTEFVREPIYPRESRFIPF